MALETTDKKMPHAELVAKTERELATITQSQAKAKSRLSAMQAEIERITAQASSRTAILADLRQEVIRLRQARQESHSYASLAVGTTAERKAMATLKDLEKELSEAEGTLREAEAHDGQAQQAEHERLEALRLEVQAAQQQLQELSARHAEVDRVHRQSIQELGQVICDEAVTSIEKAKSHVQERRDTVVDAQLSLAREIDLALSSLREWPEHQARLRRLYVVHHDSITEFLETSIALRAKLLDSAISLDIDPDVQRLAGEQYPDLATLLSLDIQLIQQALAGRKPPLLNEQRAKQERLLTAYRTFKSQAGV